MLDFLPYDPVGHGVDIETDDMAADAVRFQKRRPPSHEGISDPDALQIVRLVEDLAKGPPENSESSSPRNSVPGRRANHLCTAMIGR